MTGLNITLEFSGGAELLFDKVKKHQVCNALSHLNTLKQKVSKLSLHDDSYNNAKCSILILVYKKSAPHKILI